jgi:inosose dehydratase
LLTGQLKTPQRLDENGWSRLIEATHKVADLVRDHFQLRTVFHPHSDTHVEYEDQIERFLEETDPGLVGLCLDTGHHAYRGGDPVAFVRRHRHRVHYLHLKSIDRDVQRKVELEKVPYAQAVAMQMFCEPSQGAVDFTAFRQVLQKINYHGWAIVEQDMYPAPFDKPSISHCRSHAEPVNICETSVSVDAMTASVCVDTPDWRRFVPCRRLCALARRLNPAAWKA